MENILELPYPDDIIMRMLVSLFGPGTMIVFILALTNLLWSWYSGARSTVRFGATSVRVAGAAGSRLLKMRPITVILALLTTILMLALQGLWLWTCYVVGNAWSYVLRGIPENGPEWNKVLQTLQWDTASKIYFAASVAALILSYVLVNVDGGGALIAFILGAPAILFGILTGLGSVITLLSIVLQLIVKQHAEIDSYGKGALVSTGLVLVYLVSTYSVLSSPRLMVKAWTQY